MRYEVIGFGGLRTTDGKHGPGPDLDAVADELTEMYEMVARRGGQIVGSHVLTYHHPADVPPRPNVPGAREIPSEFIFLVAELPDQPDDDTEMTSAEG
jgi:hypothetical protein